MEKTGVTKHTQDDFLEMRRRGVSLREIAAHFERSESTVWNWIERAVKEGLLKNREKNALWTDQCNQTLRQMRSHGKTARQIGEALGRSERAVQEQVRVLGIARRKPEPWNDLRDQMVREGYRSGDSIEEIANRIGVSPGSVAGRASRLGLSGTKLHAPYPVNRKPVKRAPGSVKTDHLRDPAVRAKAAATRRANLGMRPIPMKKAKVVPVEVIPETARPWISRKFGECSYPYGARGNIHSCCQPTWLGTTFCEDHAGICFEQRKSA